jgi:hypothetical protein
VERPSPLKLASEFFEAFCRLLPTMDGMSWGILPEEEKSAMVEAMERVVCRRIDALLVELDLERKLGSLTIEPAPPEVVHPDVVCYYCEKNMAVRWYACADCLKGERA